MTYKEAFEVCRDLPPTNYNEVCKKALEKQMPKKPTFEKLMMTGSGNIIYDIWICPCCGDRYEFDCEIHNHCPTCGQAIDWSDK